MEDDVWNRPTDEELAKLPAYRSTENIPFEDKIIHLHLYIGACHWYIAEYQPEHRIFFGFANLGDPQNAEWGDIPLDELDEIDIKGVQVERDLHWKPARFRDIEEEAQSQHNPFYLFIIVREPKGREQTLPTLERQSQLNGDANGGTTKL